jgi:hypothetical protein
MNQGQVIITIGQQSVTVNDVYEVSMTLLSLSNRPVYLRTAITNENPDWFANRVGHSVQHEFTHFLTWFSDFIQIVWERELSSLLGWAKLCEFIRVLPHIVNGVKANCKMIYFTAAIAETNSSTET